MAKIADFGLSKLVNVLSHENSGLLYDDTTTANRGGALRWLAPELLGAEDGEDSDSATPPPFTKETDVYSYGMMMIEVQFLQWSLWLSTLVD